MTCLDCECALAIPTNSTCDLCCVRLSFLSNVTRTSASSMALIHFPSHPRFLPIPGGLHVHTHATPILVDRTLSLPILVVLPLIIPFTYLYYICSPDPQFTSPMPSCSTGTILIISRALYLTIGPWRCHPFALTTFLVSDSAPVILTIVSVHDSVSPLPLPYHRYLTQFSFCLPFSVLPLTAWSVLSPLTYINPL
jgi:hypothetical protein